MFTRRFWRRALERAVKSAAQAAALALGSAPFNGLEANWQTAGGFALGAAVLSLLTSLASTYGGDPSDPSLTS